MAQTNYRKWTQEEINTLLAAVSDNPECLKRAFEAASQVLNRTPNSCAQKYSKLPNTITTNKRWTKEEVKILNEVVSKNPGNLLKAFEIVAQKTGRHFNGVQSKYYSLKDNKTFALISRASATPGRKNFNTPRSSSSMITTLWNKIVSLLS